MHSRVALLIGVALLVAGWAAASSGRSAGPASAAPRAPIVYGYPYASRCPAAGLADAIDRWAMEVCNCTSYVAWALQENGQRLDWFVPGAMDAFNWPHVAQLSHLRVGRRPRVGAVAVWPDLAPPFGHVAYVTRVDTDGGFDVSEYNFPELGHFEFDQRAEVSPHGAVFIYVPRRQRDRTT